MKPFNVMRLRRPGGGGGGGGAYLDGLATSPNYVWGLRKLISTATLAIRVRRSSDDTQQDIGFSGDALDTAALATFVGANNGFLTKFYGQNGAGDLVSSGSSKQPRIVNAGVYDAAAVFDGINHCLQTATLTMGTPRAWTFGKWSHAADSGVHVIAELSLNYATIDGNRYVIYTDSATNIVGGMGELSTRRINGFPSSTGVSAWTFRFDKSVTGIGEIEAWRDGSSLTASVIISNEQSGNFDNHALNVGARDNGAGFPTAVNLQAMAIYTADVASIRSDIEAIVGA